MSRVEGGETVGKILIISAIILVAILLLVFLWPQKPEKETDGDTKAKK